MRARPAPEPTEKTMKTWTSFLEDLSEF